MSISGEIGLLVGRTVKAVVVAEDEEESVNRNAVFLLLDDGHSCMISNPQIVMPRRTYSMGMTNVIRNLGEVFTKVQVYLRKDAIEATPEEIQAAIEAERKEVTP